MPGHFSLWLSIIIFPLGPHYEKITTISPNATELNENYIWSVCMCCECVRKQKQNV